MSEDPRQSLQFLPRKDLVVFSVILRIRRPAIHAPEVAPVRYRDPEIRDLSTEFVVQRHLKGIQNKTARSSLLESGARRKYAHFRRVAPCQAANSPLSDSSGRHRRFRPDPWPAL